MPTRPGKKPRGPAQEPNSEADPSGCEACGSEGGREDDGRRAVAVDPEIKARNLNRLRRLEGQVRGIQRMVEEDRYCPDILIQVSSVQEALRGVSRELMRNHLKHCAASAIRSSEQEAEAVYDELVDMMYRSIR